MREYIAVCTECKSQQPDSYVEKSGFYAEGLAPPCKYCAGVAAIIPADELKSFLISVDKKRGLS